MFSLRYINCVNTSISDADSRNVFFNGMKDTKYHAGEVLLIHTQKYKMEESVKTEHNLATQAVYENFYTY